MPSVFCLVSCGCDQRVVIGAVRTPPRMGMGIFPYLGAEEVLKLRISRI